VRRRFITRTDIDALVERGELTLPVDDRTTVTDLAREHAQQRGVRLVRSPGGDERDRGERGDREGRPGAASSDGAAPVPASDHAEVRAAVRSAVIGQLGQVPAGLDAAIERVLAAHEGT
jgi:hypothetical protein